MNIAFVCNEYPPLPGGGIGRVTQTLARALSEQGHRIQVIGFGRKEQQFQDGPVTVRLLKERGLRGISGRANRRLLHRWLQDRVQELDVVETPDFLGPLPWSLGNVPVVVRLHQTWTRLHGGSASVERWERRQLKQHPHWIAVSESILEDTLAFAGFDPATSRVIANPVAQAIIENENRISTPQNFVLFAGRATEQKGIDCVLEAMHQVQQDRPDLHLLIAGEASTRVETQARKLRRVHFLGHLPAASLQHVMGKAQLVISMSRMEAFGLVLAEAMSFGRPVIASRIPAHEELIHQNQNGFLVEPDHADDLADAIRLVLDDPNRALRCGRAARASIAARCLPTHAAEQSLDFYRRCLEAW